MRTSRKFIAATAVAAAGLTLSASPANAHVGIDETEQTAGSYTVLGFGVPHGCDGSPTTEVAISIPESILSVTPNRNPYYDVRVETETLDTPVTGSHGEEITEREAVVVYTAKEALPDGLRDQLDISLQVPEDAAGQTLYFPTVQTCEVGETAWIDIAEDGQDPHDLEAPAPSINVVAAAEGHGEHGSAGGDDHGTDDATDGAATDDAGEDDAVSADPVAVDGEQAASSAPADGGDDGNGLAIAALVVGGLGVAVGGAGFAKASKASKAAGTTEASA